MQLSRRLKTVADQVTKGHVVADIGCDHAYTSIYLVNNNIAPKVIAMDINDGPLKRAKHNIERYGLENKIEIRKSDGASQLHPNEVDTLLIGGMGGALVNKILSDSKVVVDSAKELILQPQSEIFTVRKYLHSIGFGIIGEDMIYEDDKYYVIIKAIPKIEVYEKEVYYLYGKCLLDSNNITLKQYLKKCFMSCHILKEKLTDQISVKSQERLQEVYKELSYIEEGLAYYK